MGSRDRDTKTLQDKLKVFFKKAGVPARSEFAVTLELERELSPETPLPRRLRAARDLTDRVLQLRVQDGGVERIWRATRDMLDVNGSAGAEARHAALGLLRAICEGQADRLSVMRTVLFRYLTESHTRRPQEDEQPRFRLMYTLTNTGKNISCFEEQVGAFLVEWMPQIQNPALQVEFLQLVTNVVKFNASSLDEDVVHGIVKSACGVLESGAGGTSGESNADVGGASLALLEAVVSYSLLPRAALPTFLGALCRTVNLEAYTEHSWKLMRCVVGADIGHAAIHSLVEIARGSNETNGEIDAGLVRGAVFYINMALWGPRRVPTLKVSFLAVLPAFLKAVEMNQPVVTYEVVAALSALVTRAHSELHEPAWDILLQVIRAVKDSDTSQNRNELIHSRVHALITAIEQLHLAHQYTGSTRSLLELVDTKANALGPVSGEWTSAALQLADKYLRHDPRRAVRLHTLDALRGFIRRNKLVYGEELVERVGLPVASACALDAEPSVRAAAASALTELAKICTSDVTADLLELLEKILNRPFEMYVTDVPIPAEADVNDLKVAATGLLELLHDKLLRSPAAHPARALLILLDHLDHHYRRPALFHHHPDIRLKLLHDKLLRSPAAHPARALLILLDHLDHHYRRPALFHHHPDIRLKIFEMVFGLRANAFNCVGFCYDEQGKPVYGPNSARLKPLCSPFLMVEPVQARGQVSTAPPRDAPPTSPGSCVIGGGRAARALTAALTRETDWAVLGCVLRALPSLLQTRALAVGRRAQDLDMLASTLCAMVSDRSLYFPECLRVPGGGKLTLSEFQTVALPPLAVLAPYHSFLEPHTQQRIVRCLLRFGMVAPLVPGGGKLTLSEFQTVALPPLAVLAPYHSFLEPHTQQRIVRCLLRFGMESITEDRIKIDLDYSRTKSTWWGETDVVRVPDGRSTAFGCFSAVSFVFGATYTTENSAMSAKVWDGVPGGGKLTLSEFQTVALPPLAVLAPYHSFLEPHTQQRIVRCLLRFGMVLRTPQPYINALTIFTLETRETMVKMLPEVLLDLSKISDTKNIASPMLEFLSTLTRLPRVFASFVEDQYMSVFAILLPYTNPSRYNNYVVSLAHHVIAAWFLKCRLSYRRNFVRFIIHGLHNYTLMPFEFGSLGCLEYSFFLKWYTFLYKTYQITVTIKYKKNVAILLPYTNPSRYNNYVVSLAHHVIAAWFLKCRLSYRRNFVRFIIHGLHNYTLMPFEVSNIRDYRVYLSSPKNKSRF
ncbi:tuberin domain-containing protein [Phthorimaea operculella]|nr:tuberin domain-containing protein [Phthorimaea operculella]